MPHPLRLLMAQINPTVGAIHANTQKIQHIIETHQDQHIIVFPELAITGYPPDDLLLRTRLYQEVEESLTRLQHRIKNTYVILGHPSTDGVHRYNSASIFYQGQRVALYHKQHLPHTTVFDEYRYFTPGPSTACVFDLQGERCGLCICEDLWQELTVQQFKAQQVTRVFCINASPWHEGKEQQRRRIANLYAHQGMDVIYVNQVGGQDALVFDGQSFILDRTGHIQASAPAFVESNLEVHVHHHHWQAHITPPLSRHQIIYQALVCGLKDYVEKNHFPGVLLGLSGGIDSALSLLIAVDALGPSRVHVVLMPSQYTALMSVEDAWEQLNQLHVRHTLLPIEPALDTILSTLAPAFANTRADLTEQNLQARIRGLFLMALSNKTGYMVISTSNKSESAVGYSTLYGDMCGGFCVLKDVYKTLVYALAKDDARIPERCITRPPTAELAEDQTDQDDLPDYAILDEIIQCYMEENLDEDAIILRGHTKTLVSSIITRIKRAEFKRQHAAPGVKITACAFGKDWRYPITSGF